MVQEYLHLHYSIFVIHKEVKLVNGVKAEEEEVMREYLLSE